SIYVESLSKSQFHMEHFKYVVKHGQLNGKIQTTSTEVLQGKNMGKVNETSTHHQCILEAESLWTKQKDRKGYSIDIPKKKPLRPMLAKSYDKDGKHIQFPSYVSPKLDGLRCLAKRTKNGVGLLSRQGKQFKTLPHIEKQLMWLPIDTILDGELYIHGEEFQNIISAVKRDSPSDKSKDIQYHVYDIISDNDYETRLTWLRKWLPPLDYLGIPTIYNIDITHIFCVRSIMIKNMQEVWKYHKEFTNEGYEGAMLRNIKGSYLIDRRSKDLQKVKKFIDMEFPIIGVEECKGKMKGMCSFVCETKDGITFKCMPEGTEQIRKKYLTDWYNNKIVKGDLLTIKFFSWTTSENPVPRFPIGKCIRNYE
ncbi:hypothetical protein LCGC14_2831020, partial [marine sediment metagenome]